jgi:type III secretion translocon protein HrpF
MNTTVSRHPPSAQFAAHGAAMQGCMRQPASQRNPAMPSPLAAAIWGAAMMMLKSQLQGAQGAQGAGAGCGAAGGALDKPTASPALENVNDKPAARPQQGELDFAKFVELVRQLCNSAFSAGSGISVGQPQQDSDPCLARPQAAAVDPAVEQKRMETIAILGRHEGKFKKAVDSNGLDKMLKDEKTPPDLKRAIQDLKADPEMMEALDKAKTGKTDGKISAKDINILQSNAANKAFAEQKAEDFEQTYIPSDNKDPNAKPRPITNNDAQRELFRYSDYLPKHVSRESLQKIVDGTAEQGKCPPQLVAAAKFYVDNPAAWEKDMGKGPDESIRKDGLCNRFAKSMELTAEEDKILKVLDENRSTFFGKGNLTDAKLKQIAEDPAAKPEVRDTARALQDKKGSLLHAMLDNGKHGHGGNLIHAANDRSIGQGDLNRVLEQRNKTIAPAEKTASPAEIAAAEKTAKTAQSGRAAPTAAAQAAQDMSDGTYNQPDNKTKKGGQLRDIANFFLKAYSFITNIASSVLSAVAALKIPGLSQLAAVGAMGAQAASGLAKIGSAALEQGDVKGAAIGAGIGMATTAAGLVIPGGGKIVGEAAENAAKGGAKTWSTQAVNSSTDITNGQVAQVAGKAAATSTATTAASTAFTESGAKAEVTGQATNQAHAYQQQHA